MSSKRAFTKKLALFFFIVFVVALLNPTKTEKSESKALETLTPSIFVNESARFHPLLRQGTFGPIADQKLENVRSYLVVNAETGEVYTAKNATERVAPASLVKLMTAMIALDVTPPNTQLVASGRAASEEPTALGVKPGETFSLEELIPALIATSANDAASIIAEETLYEYGGNEQIFIALMNKKAEELGLGDTRFANAQGFDDPNQYSNAYDLSRLAHYAYTNYPPIRKAAAAVYSTIEETAAHGFYHLPNWNALLGTYPGVDGLKIGYTENAGYCTIVTATQDETSLIVVVIGAESIPQRDLAAATLLNNAFGQEELPGTHVSESLIEPRLDQWRTLREQILKEIENEENGTRR